MTLPFSRRTLMIAAAAAVMVVLAAWFVSARRPEVRVVTPTRGTAAEIVYATGAVEPERWAKVASLVRHRIVEICNCEGREVALGDVLVRLDDREVRAGLTELKAREDFARHELERTTQLQARGITTPQALERAATELRQIQGLITVQSERLAAYEIRSPMSGTVLRRDGQIGEIAEPGQILFRVGVPQPMLVVAEVNEEDIPRVVVGQRVLFRTDAFRGVDLAGVVSELTPLGDPVAKTYRIKIALPTDSPLRFGMSVEANIVVREKANAMLIPAAAVSGKVVFVVDGSRVRKTEIGIGLRGTRMIEVVSGLDETSRIVSPASDSLRDGQSVRVSAAPSDPPPAK